MNLPSQTSLNDARSRAGPAILQGSHAYSLVKGAPLIPKCRAVARTLHEKTKKQVLMDADSHKLEPVVFIQDKDFDDLIGTLPTYPSVVTLNR